MDREPFRQRAGAKQLSQGLNNGFITDFLLI